MDWVERCDKEAADMEAVISRIVARCDAGELPDEVRDALIMLRKRLDTLREFVIDEVSAMHDAQLLRGWSEEEAKLIAEMDPFRLSVQGDGL